jgi:hypothetical protein
LAIGLALWLFMEMTRMGAAVRATVDDAQMARGVGIDTNRVSMSSSRSAHFWRRWAASSAVPFSEFIQGSILRCCLLPLPS